MHHWEQVDVVLSGINLGSNLGNAMWHSGALTAARQAVLFGARVIAFSVPVGPDEPDFGALGRPVCRVLRALLPASELALVNVNLPAINPRGHAGRASPCATATDRSSPGPTRWAESTSGSSSARWRADPESDRWAVEHGCVSMTPLRLNLTSQDDLARVWRLHPVQE